jgi:23S rRNA (cytosine1962-C5)-methyltransferase
LKNAPTETLWGNLPANVFAARGALRFHIPIAQQQNTGFFLDMEPGRAWLENNVNNKRVLNLFAYTCAFSVVAVAAGAEQVVNVDMSSRALQWGRQNHLLNGFAKDASVFLAEDILKSWGRIKRRGPYDIVIIDPPSYQPGSFVAQKDYAKVVRRIPELMPNGGSVLACLNAPEIGIDFMMSLFAEACPGCSFVQRLEPSADFPDENSDQQLKLLVFDYAPQ